MSTLQLPKIEPPPELLADPVTDTDSAAPWPGNPGIDIDTEEIDAIDAEEGEGYNPAAVAAEIGASTEAPTAAGSVKVRVIGPSARASHALLAGAAALAVLAAAHPVTEFIEHGPVMPGGRPTPSTAIAPDSPDCVMLCNTPPMPECVISDCSTSPTGAAAMVATLLRIAE